MADKDVEYPESMDDLIYFTRRKVFDGRVIAWLFKEPCPECGEAVLEKPINEKTGKKKTRSPYYTCSECGYKEKKSEHMDGKMLNIEYICPHCEHEGTTKAPYERRSYLGIKSVVFNCGECEQEIPITKKMKKPDRLKKK